MTNYIGEAQEKRLHNLLKQEEDANSIIQCLKMIEEILHKKDVYNNSGKENFKISSKEIDDIRMKVGTYRTQIQAELYRIMKGKE